MEMTSIAKWRGVDGDNTYALDWPLDENSHVWEIGGFEGRWAQQIWDKFHCNITIFEPQLWAVARMQERFSGIKKINIRPYGLWTKTTVLPIGNFETDGATIVNVLDGKGTKAYGSFRLVYDDLPYRPVDVCLMNVEGAEYTLIPNFIDNAVINYFSHFWCQFHPEDEQDIRHLEIFNEMDKTHDRIWNCFPTAVAWRKR